MTKKCENGNGAFEAAGVPHSVEVTGCRVESFHHFVARPVAIQLLWILLKQPLDICVDLTFFLQKRKSSIKTQ